MKYKQFEKYMLSIKKSMDLQDESYGYIDMDFLSKAVNEIIDQFIELIGEQFEDPFDTISWFIFDCEFGTDSPNVTDENGEEFVLDTIKSLWDFLSKK